MPFADGEFDLILSRHSAFQADEVARMLSPGGTFLTQQVHWMWAHDLLAVSGARPPRPETTLEVTLAAIEAAGLVIVTAEEWSGELAFTDVGAVVYYLKAVPWLMPGSVDCHTPPRRASRRRSVTANTLQTARQRRCVIVVPSRPFIPIGPPQPRSTTS